MLPISSFAPPPPFVVFLLLSFSLTLAYVSIIITSAFFPFLLHVFFFLLLQFFVSLIIFSIFLLFQPKSFVFFSTPLTSTFVFYFSQPFFFLGLSVFFAKPTVQPFFSVILHLFVAVIHAPFFHAPVTLKCSYGSILLGRTIEVCFICRREYFITH